MTKKKLGPQPMVWPHPAVLVGSLTDEKPDFAAVAWTGVAASNPPCATIALQHHRHSLKGIKQNMTFSINIPSSDFVKETDYCGIISGKDTDKAKDCGFDITYGELKTAPMIGQFPVNMELEALHILNLGSHALVVGKIVETFINEDCLTNDKPDFRKVKPFTFINREYQSVGGNIGAAFSIGKELKKK